MDSFSAETELVRRLVCEAGQRILADRRQGLRVSYKADGEPVTETDRAVNAFLVAELRRHFPNDLVVSEENEDDDPARRATAQRVWFVDPIDGTKEFLAGNDEFSVMVGLCVDGTPTLGVVYQPTTKKTWYATPQGAWLEALGERRRLTVSSVAHIPAMTLAVSRSHRNRRLQTAIERLGIQNTIVSGSGGLKIGLLVEQRADLFISTSRRAKLWDTAGPEAILRAAGGVMTDFHGRPLDYRRPELHHCAGLIASNGVRHAAIVAQLHDVFPPG
ncbi:MAG: 3'(2'),5'-bisphosphate nucleotidase CysQ [Chloracidobacterium sp.]|nr:3'(2'),5'-bisphosphate nucleotidase CysQ [Chloracidobacterium sp.]MDW8216698.1 inositol monophosphatase family protein [Acidobacteriota bacterium]